MNDSLVIAGKTYDSRLLVGTGCFLIMQIKDGAFERYYPEEPGTFECADENIAPINDPDLDGSAFTW